MSFTGGEEVGSARIVVNPDVSGFQRGIDRQIGPSIDRTGRHISSSLGGAFRSVALTAGGLFAAVGVGKFLQSSIAEARDAARVGRETAAVLRSTGSAAGQSAKQIELMSRNLGRLVGVDNDVIQDGLNLLLTFTNIKDDVFPGATRAIVDLTAAMNDGVVTSEGLQASTVQVGKALNDPIKGITALTRVGVTFNEQQKDQIRFMVENGHTADAQRVILKELGKEFGGLAQASADPFQRFGVAIDEIKEKIGTALLPALGGVATAFGTLLDVWDVAGFEGVKDVLGNWFKTSLIPWLQENVPRVLRWIFDTGLNILEAAGRFLGWLLLWFRETAIPWLQENVPKLPDYFISGMDVVSDWLDVTVKPWIDNTLKPWLDTNLPKLGSFLLGSAQDFVDAIGQIPGWIQQWVESGGAERIGEQVGKAYASFIQWFWEDLNGIRLIAAVLFFIGKLFATLMIEIPKGFVEAAIAGIGGFIRGVADRLLGRGGHQSGLQEVVDTFINLADHWVQVGVEWAKRVWDGFVDWVKDHAPGIGDIIGGVISAALPGGDGWGIEKAARATNAFGAAVGSGKIPDGGSVIGQLVGYLKNSGTPFGVSSTFRPGARTKSGNMSLHAVGRAVDFVGPSLINIFRAFLPVAGNLKELIYSGAGFSIKNGRKVPAYAVADHWDHVHVALAQGGIVTRPTMALTGEKGPEAVIPLSGGGGFQIAVYVGNQQITDIVDVQINGVSREAEDMLLRGMAS